MRQSRFESYVDAARNGKNDVWRILVGILIIAVVWFAGTLAAFCVGVVAIRFRDEGTLYRIDEIFEAVDYSALSGDPIGIAVVLISIASLWIGVWLALKIVHRRSIRDLFGIDRRLYWGDFVRSSIVTLAVSIGTIPITLLIDPTIMRGSISLSAWLVALLPLLAGCFLQTSAEEVTFRGYLHQVLAARFPRTIVWFAMPTALFTLMHWDGEAPAVMNLAMLATILVFSACMTHLLTSTGNLAAAMGSHFSNNVAAFMLFSTQPDFGGAALFVGRSVRDPSWTPFQAAAIGLLGIATVLLAQVLLLHRLSPVRLRSLP